MKERRNQCSEKWVSLLKSAAAVRMNVVSVGLYAATVSRCVRDRATLVEGLLAGSVLASARHLGERGESVLVGKVDRGVVATATTGTTATAGTALTTGSTTVAATGTATARALNSGLVEGLLNLEDLLALLLGVGLGLLGLGRGEVVSLLLLVLGELGPGGVVGSDLTGSLGLNVELLAGLGGKVLVEGHSLVLLLLGDLLGLDGSSGGGSALGGLGLSVGLSLLLNVELLLAVLTAPTLGDGLLRVDTVGLRVTVEGTATGGTTATTTATTATALTVAGTASTGVLLLLALSGGVSGAGSTVAGTTTALVAGTGDVALGLGSSSGGGGLGGGGLGGGDVLTVVCRERIAGMREASNAGEHG